ncbi:SMI1/KNR4 family protein [Microbulbifer hainanensis]|uniref:SMI1/KNR4 family protein n=1 Tax=Microbulbifer hainanensis TaxID=2735675 RepID=UPI001D01F44D|nr:SMI1/KNR4 family protein [Microbulbifer hainanensis]
MNLDGIKKTLLAWLNEGFLEGELSVEPEWYVLWRPEEVEEFNQDYQLAEYAPGFITFGGNGGGVLLVVNERGEVFHLPCTGMAPDSASRIADSLQEFKGYMQK